MSAGPRSRRRKGAAAHAGARPANRWASAAQRASRSVAARQDAGKAKTATAVRSARARGATARGNTATVGTAATPTPPAPAKRGKSRPHRLGKPRTRVRSPDVRAVNGVPFELMDWIRRSMSGDLGPVANAEVFRHSDFIFQIIKGPNQRNDYHLDPYDEIFYQLRGTAWVHLISEDGSARVAEVREGGVLLVSAFTPHSPRRPPDSIGLVVERPRREKELDGLAWYCEQCGNKLHELWLPCRDIETQLVAALQSFNADLALRTCKRCGSVLPDPTQHPPWAADRERRKV